MISIIIPKVVHMECAKTSKYPYAQYFEPLNECIESIKKQSYKDYEIIYANLDKKGTFYSLNEAFRKARGNIIFFLCPQAILISKDSLSNLVNIFNDKKTDAVVLSSKANKNMPLFIWLLCLEYEDREDFEGWVDVGAILYLALKKDVLKKIGGLNLKNTTIKTNPNFDSGFLDWDLCAKLRRKGYKIWHTNKIKLYLLYQTTLYGYFKKQFYHAWYRVAYYKKFKKIKEGYSKFNFFYPNIFKFYKKTKDLKVFLFIPVFFLRNIVWILGFIKGYWDFYIKGNLLLK